MRMAPRVDTATAVLLFGCCWSLGVRKLKGRERFGPRPTACEQRTKHLVLTRGAPGPPRPTWP